MEIPSSVCSFEALRGVKRELHLAIGVFDGVHIGHRAVIESAVFSAKRAGGMSGVLTFDPHPSRLFRPEDPTQLIMPIEAKVAMLIALGVDCVIKKRFDREFASIPADQFLAYLQKQLPNLRSISVGENFRFGKMRAGDVKTLIESGRSLGLAVFSADRIKHNGEPISSTRIRGELAKGRMAIVNDLLGYNYTSCGEIVAGAQIGRKIGFPTLNLPWEPECRPAYGVYLVSFREKGHDQWLPAVANYGVRPTVAEAEDVGPALEVHALRPVGLGPGDTIEVQWLQFIRPEQKFESLEVLKTQIAKDRDTAIRLANHG